jgi:xanthine dehydrogenase accessory factor
MEHGDHATCRPPSTDGWAVLERASEMAREGQEFALATVVWRQGPSSGQAGSRAIVTADGGLIGWIGGACAEPVVIREAKRVIEAREPKLLMLGQPDQADQSGGNLPDGMVFVPISCQSEGALQVYIEPVIPTPHLIVVGRSPMAHTLTDLAVALGWRAELFDAPQFAEVSPGAHTIVVVATQGHGDEEAVERAVLASPAFVGMVASRKRGQAVLGYLADRGVPQDQLDQVHVPVGLDLGHTAHREIAVAVLAQLVQLRAEGSLRPEVAAVTVRQATALDPVCGMTVTADASSHPYELDGVTYYFCCIGCHDRFAAAPHDYLTAAREA